MIDVATVKARIAERAAEFVRDLFGERARTAGAGKWRIGAHGSLSVELKDGELLFYSHEDGAGGDAIALWARELQCTDALKACADWAGGCRTDAPPLSHARRSKPPAPARPPNMTDAENAVAIAACERLAKDTELCARIARARAWGAETVRRCALEAVLGWHDGKLAFIYESGIKLRWRNGDERIIKWHCGEPWMWRAVFLTQAGKVVLTEGETDAISAIEAGIDCGEALVVAMPSAGTFKDGWQANFAGKTVTLALDNDEAGARAARRVAELLRPVAREVRVVNWKAVRE